jgi:protocadherin Fat 1/2/3
VGLLIIVIIFVVIVRWRKRAKQRQESRSKRDGKVEYPYNYDKLDPQGQPNITENSDHPPRSPRPPPVPNRPVSYTPSVGDSVNTLNHYNNFDSLRNYGSAGDELESMGTIRQPIEIPEFLQNVDAEKPLLTASNAGSPAPIRSLPPPPPYESPANWDHNTNDRYKEGKIPPCLSPAPLASSLIRGALVVHAVHMLPLDHISSHNQVPPLPQILRSGAR